MEIHNEEKQHGDLSPLLRCRFHHNDRRVVVPVVWWYGGTKPYFFGCFSTCWTFVVCLSQTHDCCCLDIPMVWTVRSRSANGVFIPHWLPKVLITSIAATVDYCTTQNRIFALCRVFRIMMGEDVVRHVVRIILTNHSLPYTSCSERWLRWSIITSDIVIVIVIVMVMPSFYWKWEIPAIHGLTVLPSRWH